MKSLIAISLLALTTMTQAVTCDPKEYYEYRDGARTAFGQRSLALDYCAAGQSYLTAKQRGDWHTMERCGTIMARIGDTLIAAGASKSLKWAHDGCPITK